MISFPFSLTILISDASTVIAKLKKRTPKKYRFRNLKTIIDRERVVSDNFDWSISYWTPLSFIMFMNIMKERGVQ